MRAAARMMAEGGTGGRIARHLARLGWYASRVRAMGPAEILHRFREVAVRRRWRRRPGGWDATVGDGPVRTSPLLQQRLRAAAALPCVAASARHVRSGHVRFLGRSWPAVDWREGAGPNFWLHDPVTGRPWPASGFDTRATGTDPAGPRQGDAKFVWEPGRLQFLQALAADGDGRTALAILRDFAAVNPPWSGIHWSSGIELALRMVSVTLVCSGCGEGALGPAERILIRRFAAAHATFLETFPSLHSSANNHRLAEGLGLFLAGLLVPDLGGRWLETGRTIIEETTRHLVLPDGGGAEQSPVYLAFVLEMVAFAALLAGEAGHPLSADILERLRLGAGFLKALLDGGGHAPAIGDDDETRVIAQYPDREPRYVASVVAALAGLTGRPDLAPPARDPHLRDALFASPEAPGAASAGLHVFARAGYSTAHEMLGGRESHVVFDHGPMGFGTLAAHGHADALSVWLSIDGEPVLIDAGTWLYFSAGSARLRLRESQSHNTVTLHGTSQSRASSAFGWASRAEASLVAQRSGPDWSVTGTHDGYRRRFGLAHIRRLVREDRSIAIGDRVTGGRAPAEIAFLLPADIDVSVGDRELHMVRRGVPLCRMVAPEGFAVALRRGAGEGAVRSRAFGELEDAQRIVFSGQLGSDEAVTRLRFDPVPVQPSLARTSLSENAPR